MDGVKVEVELARAADVGAIQAAAERAMREQLTYLRDLVDLLRESRA